MKNSCLEPEDRSGSLLGGEEVARGRNRGNREFRPNPLVTLRTLQVGTSTGSSYLKAVEKSLEINGTERWMQDCWQDRREKLMKIVLPSTICQLSLFKHG
jgi:hypothetical protein